MANTTASLLFSAAPAAVKMTAAELLAKFPDMEGKLRDDEQEPDSLLLDMACPACGQRDRFRIAFRGLLALCAAAWAPLVARYPEVLAAFALTEPQSGSDATAMRCKAVRQADGSFVINGKKYSNMSYADMKKIIDDALAG